MTNVDFWDTLGASIMTLWMPGVLHAMNSINHLMTYSGLGDLASSACLTMLLVFQYIFSGWAESLSSLRGRETTGMSTQDAR